MIEQKRIEGQADIDQRLDALLRAADPAEGIVKLRLNVITAEAQAARLAREASSSVSSISQQAAAASEAALSRIESSGQTLSQEAETAWSALVALAVVGILVFAATRFMVSRVISTPLAELSRKTEDLSAGNMEPIGDLTQRAGEIGQMAAALEVFRSNALKMEDLREENVRRQQEAQQEQKDMLALLSREIGTVVEAGSRGDFSSRVEHSFDDAELATLASGVNQLVGSVQDGVTEAKKALTAIANADLRYRMDARFEGIFAELREQINVTATRLSQMVSDGYRNRSRRWVHGPAPACVRQTRA